MIYYSVSTNINIKTTDGTLVKYLKSAVQNDDHIYCTTYNDYLDLKKVFSKVGKNYQAKTLFEHRLTNKSDFPRELGISNKDEYKLIKKSEFTLRNQDFILPSFEEEIIKLSLNEKKVNLEEQIKKQNKLDIKVALVGGLGKSISEIISNSTALKIFYKKLKQKFTTVILDVYIEASENKYYSRDKELILMQSCVNSVKALGLSLKKLKDYDYYVDTSMLNRRSFYKELCFVDAFLHKLGIDYKKIAASEKNNSLDVFEKKASNKLESLIKEIKTKGDILLYHPYSASMGKSIPKEHSIACLQKLIKKANNYTVVSTLKIEDIKDDRYVDLSLYSKSIFDFIYIISNSSKIITVDTSTQHIADAFFVPTVVLFTKEESMKNIKYYSLTKAYEVKDKSKDFSNFIFSHDDLIMGKYDSWKEFDILKVIKLLDTF